MICYYYSTIKNVCEGKVVNELVRKHAFFFLFLFPSFVLCVLCLSFPLTLILSLSQDHHILSEQFPHSSTATYKSSPCPNWLTSNYSSQVWLPHQHLAASFPHGGKSASPPCCGESWCKGALEPLKAHAACRLLATLAFLLCLAMPVCARSTGKARTEWTQLKLSWFAFFFPQCKAIMTF